MNNLDTKEIEQPELNSAKNIVLAISGIALEGVGLLGITSFEAKTPGDAIASVDMTSVGVDEQYITEADIPFIAILGVGAVLAFTGLNKILNRARKTD